MELRAYLQLLQRRKWIVLVVGILGAVAGGLLQAHRTPVYSATTQVLLLPDDPSERISDTSTTNVDSRRYAAAQVTVLESREVAAAAADKLSGVSAVEVHRAVTVTASDTSDVLLVTAATTSPQRSADVANAVTTSYIERRKQSDVQQLQLAAQEIGAQLDELQTRIADLRRTAGSGSNPAVEADLTAANDQYTTLFARQQDLLIDSSLKRGQARIIDPAVAPPSPDGMGRATTVVLGLLLGLLIGLGVAYLRDQLDDRIRTREELESVTALPVLAEVPEDRDAPPTADDIPAELEPFGPVAEAVRGLRTGINFFGIEEPVTHLVVTSAMPGEGKTFVTANLAVAFAQSGVRTVLVSADLRRPRIENYFGVRSGTPGLTTVLSPDERRHPPDRGDRDAVSEAVKRVLLQTHVEDLALLPCGPIPPNPAEVLASPRMRAVLDILGEYFDLVILDTSPVLAVTDAAVLAQQVGRVLLVSRAGTARRREVARMLSVLGRTPGQVLGLVQNGTRSSRAHSYGQYSSTVAGGDDGDAAGAHLAIEGDGHPPPWQLPGTEPGDAPSADPVQSSPPAEPVHASPPSGEDHLDLPRTTPAVDAGVVSGSVTHEPGAPASSPGAIDGLESAPSWATVEPEPRTADWHSTTAGATVPPLSPEDRDAGQALTGPAAELGDAARDDRDSTGDVTNPVPAGPSDDGHAVGDEAEAARRALLALHTDPHLSWHAPGWPLDDDGQAGQVSDNGTGWVSER